MGYGALDTTFEDTLKIVTCRREFPPNVPQRGKAQTLFALADQGFCVPRGISIWCPETWKGALTFHDRQRISTVCKKLCVQGNWIVRSAFFTEDGVIHAHAGEFASYPHLSTMEAICDAIEASAIEWKLRDHGGFCILVQEMVLGSHSGVCFLRESGDISLGLVQGGCESVTAGTGVVEEILLDRTTLRVISPSTLPSAEREISRFVGEVALQVYAFDPMPLDIEWTFYQGKVVVLQARPLTSEAALDLQQEIVQVEIQRLQQYPDDVWTDLSISEVFGTPSPLFTSLLQQDTGYLACIRKTLSLFGLPTYPDLTGAPIFSPICHKAYLNLSAYLRAVCPAFQIQRNPKSEVGSPFLLKFRSESTWWQRVMVGWQVLSFIRRISAVRRLVEAPPREFVESPFQETFRELTEQICPRHLSTDLLAAWGQGWLRWVLQKWKPLEAKEIEHQLISGLDNNFNVMCTQGLWDLSQGKLSLEAFLIRFGHRGNPDWEIAAPRWRETPDKVKKMALQMQHMEDPHARFVQQQKKRLEVEAAFFRWIRVHPIFRWMHKKIHRELKMLQRIIPLREETQSQVYRYMEQLRGLAQEMGRQSGLPEGDVFFLTLTEFERLPIVPLDVLSQIQQRKRERELAPRLYTPSVVDAKNCKEIGQIPSSTLDGVSYEGIGISPGYAEGVVRKVQVIDENTQVHAEDVFVMPWVDPSWASVLIQAKALILERGSSFSHSAILAREYGLPAVVCSAKWENGQRVAVNGITGKVCIL